jgi:hypothetical protein
VPWHNSCGKSILDNRVRLYGDVFVSTEAVFIQEALARSRCSEGVPRRVSQAPGRPNALLPFAGARSMRERIVIAVKRGSL